MNIKVYFCLICISAQHRWSVYNRLCVFSLIRLSFCSDSFDFSACLHLLLLGCDLSLGNLEPRLTQLMDELMFCMPCLKGTPLLFISPFILFYVDSFFHQISCCSLFCSLLYFLWHRPWMLFLHCSWFLKNCSNLTKVGFCSWVSTVYFSVGLSESLVMCLVMCIDFLLWVKLFACLASPVSYDTSIVITLQRCVWVMYILDNLFPSLSFRMKRIRFSPATFGSTW